MTTTLEDAAILLQQALSLQQDGKLQEAERLYRRVLVADPSNADAMNLLAVIHHERGDRDLAIRLLRSAIAIQPEAGRFYNNLAVVLAKHGDRIGSIAALRLSTLHSPRDHNCQMALIFALDLHPQALPSIRMADRRAFNARFCAQHTAEAPPHANDPDPDRRLRVGYVSGDFRAHSAAMAFGPVLRHHDPAAVEVTCYANNPIDEATRDGRFGPARWREVGDWDDERLVEQIRADRIDILVDLSGYSGGNRLLAFAHRPAPVQLTAWGHATGTGLDCMDYLLADDVTVPPEHEHLYTEAILRAPCVLAYDPGAGYPPVSAPPREVNGAVTFGYLGRANKTHEGTWAAWAEILHRVPGSRLLLKADDYADRHYRALVTDYLVSLRIGTSRFAFLPATDRPTHLAAYAEVDVALDSFPQSGGITTLEACLMGVPTVTLLGDFLNGRTSASILGRLGLRDLVAGHPRDYVEAAVALAARPQTLGDRLALRDRLLASIITDGPAYTAAVEALWRRAWRTWTAQHGANATTNGPVAVGR